MRANVEEPTPPEPRHAQQPPAKRNGGAPTATALTSALSDDRRQTVEAGLTFFQQVQGECDELRRQLADASDEIARLNVRLNEHDAMRATIESRINSCILERDLAVTEKAKLATVLDSIATLIGRFHRAEFPDAQHRD